MELKLVNCRLCNLTRNVIIDKDLTAGEKTVLVYVVQFGAGQVPSQTLMANLLGCSRSMVCKYYKSLVRKNRISKTGNKFFLVGQDA